MFRKRMTAVDEELKAQIKTLRADISRLRRERQPRSQVWEGCRQGRDFETPQALKLKKVITERDGGEIKAIDFGVDNILMTLSSGTKSYGLAHIFDPTSDGPPEVIALKNQWILDGAIEPEQSRLLVFAGLSNVNYIYDLNNIQEWLSETDTGSPPNLELEGHSSCIYECKFSKPNEIVSVGDQSIRVWDIEQARCKTTFLGHTGDAFCVDSHPDPTRNLFLSGAGDYTVRLWDADVQGDRMRAQASLTFDTLSRDVTSVSFFPDGQAFAAGLNNSCIHMYDIRASTKILTLRHPQTFHKTGVEQVKFSASGRLVFVRYANKSVLCYDLAAATKDTPEGEVYNDNILHEAISSEPSGAIAVSPNGSVFGAGILSPQKNALIAHLYWPNGRRR